MPILILIGFFYLLVLESLSLVCIRG